MKSPQTNQGEMPLSQGANSVLSQLFQLLETSVGGPLINFEDISGVSYDLEDLFLPDKFRIHTCSLCLLAKNTPAGQKDCIRNKLAVNRLASGRGAGFTGMCHMGITELVEPLDYQGTVLGVFYYGGFVVEETRAAGEERIRRHCARRNLQPEPFLAEHRALKVISKQELAVLQDRLRLVTQVAARLLAAKGIQADGYTTLPSAYYSHRRWRFPAMVRAAMGVIETHYSEPLTLGEVAATLHCHPDYLGRVFRRATGESFGDYLARYRVERACRLIEAQEALTLGEVAWRVGFQDQSHFGRVFRRITGSSPGDYRRSAFEKEATAIVYGESRLSLLADRGDEGE